MELKMPYKQVKYYFEELQEFLKQDIPQDVGYYLTRVSITDKPEIDGIRVEFEVYYGPVANFIITPNCKSIRGQMLTLSYWFDYGKDGCFKRWSGDTFFPNANFFPKLCIVPSPDDFPHCESLCKKGENITLIGCVLNLLRKLRTVSLPLHSVSFSVDKPEGGVVDFSLGLLQTHDSPAEPPYVECEVRGLSLVQDLLESFNYNYMIRVNFDYPDEYDLSIVISNPDLCADEIPMCYNEGSYAL